MALLVDSPLTRCCWPVGWVGSFISGAENARAAARRCDGRRMMAELFCAVWQRREFEDLPEFVRAESQFSLTYLDAAELVTGRQLTL